MTASAPQVTAPAPHPNRGWDTFFNAVIPVSGLVAAIATIMITYQVSRISELGTAIQNVNNRVDQLYPQISQATADIGIIKGSLIVATQTIDNVSQKVTKIAEQNEFISKRVDILIGNQEDQMKSIQALTLTVADLVTTVKGEQKQLDEIKRKINLEP